MKCPKCKAAASLHTIKKRDKRDGGNAVIRRKECRLCKFRFNTIEMVQEDVVEFMKFVPTTA